MRSPGSETGLKMDYPDGTRSGPAFPLSKCVGAAAFTPTAPDLGWRPTTTRTSAGHSSRTPPIRPIASWPRPAGGRQPGAVRRSGSWLAALPRAGLTTASRCPEPPALLAAFPTNPTPARQKTGTSAAESARPAFPLRRSRRQLPPRIVRPRTRRSRLRGCSRPDNAGGPAGSSAGWRRCVHTPCISSA
jgi:hypothetical protein